MFPLSALYHKYATLISVLLAPILLCSPRTRFRIADRFGKWRLPKERYVWFHAASFGEMRGMLPIVERYMERFPGKKILLTAASDTGYRLATDFAEGRDVTTRILMLDAPHWIKRALNGIEIDCFFFGETELWPNLLRYLEERNVPRILVNGRISESTKGRYRRYSSLFSNSISKLSLCLMGDEASANEIRELGADSNRVQVTGNAKYSRVPSVESAPTQEFFSEINPSGEPLFVLGSIHPGEEEIWLGPISKALSEMELSIVLAPRHIDKVPYFEEALRSNAISFKRRSEWKTKPGKVVVLDSMGELEKIYSMASLVFIGGTLNHLGGHNPLEAAMYGIPAILGPSRHKISEVAEDLIAAKGCIAIGFDEKDAYEALKHIQDSPEELASIGENGKAVYEKYSKALDRIFDSLESAHLI